MSQCYQVSLKSSVSRVVKGEDSITYPIEFEEILPDEDMAEILKGVLEKNGWKKSSEDSNIFTTEGEAGETISINLDEMEVEVSLKQQKEVSAEVEVHESSGQSKRDAKDRARHRLQETQAQKGDQIEDQGNKELQKEVTEALTKSEEARRVMLNEIVQEVYAESLKRKAGQLGEILEISESTNDDGNYELNIRVAQ